MVSIVTLVWDHPELTATLLDGLHIYTPEPYELIIVDNGSGQTTKDLLQAFKAQRKPDTRIITNVVNEGFGRGMNAGMNAATGDFIILISNDVMITDREWVSKLIDPLKEKKCMTGGQYINYNTLTMIGSQIIDYLGGWLLAFPRQFIQEVGGFDDLYGKAYFEDVDLCFRAKYVHGYELVEVQTGCKHDHPSASVGDGRLNMTAIGMENQLKYRNKIVRLINEHNIVLPSSITGQLKGV